METIVSNGSAHSQECDMALVTRPLNSFNKLIKSIFFYVNRFFYTVMVASIRSYFFILKNGGHFFSSGLGNWNDCDISFKLKKISAGLETCLSRLVCVVVFFFARIP